MIHQLAAERLRDYLSRRNIASEITQSDEYASSGGAWQRVSNSATSSSANSLSTFWSDSARDFKDTTGWSCCSKNRLTSRSSGRNIRFSKRLFSVRSSCALLGYSWASC